ncbi:MAG: hypothetical protein N3G22_00540 [Candidatus Micrarchaeota archaeon]|nr:hypothetical protein [Candidatus Micrarchaeota archaeon]
MPPILQKTEPQRSVDEELTLLKKDVLSRLEQGATLENLSYIFSQAQALSKRVDADKTLSAEDKSRLIAFSRALVEIVNENIKGIEGTDKLKEELNNEQKKLTDHINNINSLGLGKTYQRIANEINLAFLLESAFKANGLALDENTVEKIKNCILTSEDLSQNVTQIYFASEENAKKFKSAMESLPLQKSKLEIYHADKVPGGKDGAKYCVIFNLSVPETVPFFSGITAYKEASTQSPEPASKLITRRVESHKILKPPVSSQSDQIPFCKVESEQEREIDLLSTGQFAYSRRFKVEDPASEEVARSLADSAIRKYAQMYNYKLSPGQSIVDFLKTDEGQGFIKKFNAAGGNLEIIGSASQEVIYDGTNFDEWLSQARKNLELAQERARAAWNYLSEINAALKMEGKETLLVQDGLEGKIFFFQPNLPTAETPEIKKALKKHGFKSLDEAYGQLGYNSQEAHAHLQSFMKTLKEKDKQAHDALISSGAISLSESGEYSIADAKKLRAAFYRVERGGMRDEDSRNGFVEAIEECHGGAARSVTLKKRVKARLKISIHDASKGIFLVEQFINNESVRFEGSVHVFSSNKDKELEVKRIEPAESGFFVAAISEDMRGGHIGAYAEDIQTGLNSGMVGAYLPMPPQDKKVKLPATSNIPRNIGRFEQNYVPMNFTLFGELPLSTDFPGYTSLIRDFQDIAKNLGLKPKEESIIGGKIKLSPEQAIYFLNKWGEAVDKWMETKINIGGKLISIGAYLKDYFKDDSKYEMLVQKLKRGQFKSAFEGVQDPKFQQAIDFKNLKDAEEISVKVLLDPSSAIELLQYSLSAGANVVFDLDEKGSKRLHVYLDYSKGFIITNKEQTIDKLRVDANLIFSLESQDPHSPIVFIGPSVEASQIASPIWSVKVGAEKEIPINEFLLGIVGATASTLFTKLQKPVYPSNIYGGVDINVFDNPEHKLDLNLTLSKSFFTLTDRSNSIVSHPLNIDVGAQYTINNRDGSPAAIFNAGFNTYLKNGKIKNGKKPWGARLTITVPM